jgi:hypothetical protein
MSTLVLASWSSYYQLSIDRGPMYSRRATGLVFNQNMPAPEMILINNRTIMIGGGTALLMAMPSRT